MRRALSNLVLVAAALATSAPTLAHADAEEPEAPAAPETKNSSDPAPSTPADNPIANGDASSHVTELPSNVQSPDKVTGPESLRPWRFSGTLGVVSLPRPLSLEVLARKRRAADPRWDLFGVGAGIEYLPANVASFGDTTTLSWMQVGADGRWFPWRWAFVGARLGWQFSRADSEKFGSEVDYVTTSFFVAPKIGVLHTFASGLTIGGELGVSIPFAADTKLESDGTEDSNARKVSKTFGMFTMPVLSAFRIGYTF